VGDRYLIVHRHKLFARHASNNSANSDATEPSKKAVAGTDATKTMRVTASTLFSPESVRQKMAQLEAKRKNKQVARKGKTVAAPEQLLYSSKTTGTFNAINTIFTLGAVRVS
jgi:hypothetical protein